MALVQSQLRTRFAHSLAQLPQPSTVACGSLCICSEICSYDWLVIPPPTVKFKQIISIFDLGSKTGIVPAYGGGLFYAGPDYLFECLAVTHLRVARQFIFPGKSQILTREPRPISHIATTRKYSGNTDKGHGSS